MGKYRRQVLVLSVVAAAALLFGHRSIAQEQESSARQTQEGPTGADWPFYGGNHLAWRYSALDQINTATVKKLVPAWIFQTGDYTEALQATPIVVDGILYISTARDYVFALDGATGEVIWQYKHQPIPGLPPGLAPQNRGLAVGDGKVFIGTYDSFVIALDAKTGQVIWREAVEDRSTCGCSISGAPLVAGDKVLVGGSGSGRGYIAAFDMRTGRQAWRFYTVPGPGEKGNETWTDGLWKRGGANPWVTGSYDPELKLTYWGTGNPAPGFFGDMRPGDNLYGASILALDIDTGKLRWYYQEVPHDTWDYDSNWECMLLDRQVGGRIRKLLVHFNKGGIAWVLDRETGEVLGTYKVAEVINWVTGVTEKGELVGRNDALMSLPPKLICPSNLGQKNWNQNAYSPRTGWIYTPSNEMCNDIVVRPPMNGRPGGATWVMKPPPGHDLPYAHIDALDPVTGKRMWTYPYKYEFFSSMLATAGDLVFTGDVEGHYIALDARTGEKLWSFQTGAGHRGGSITYMVGGRQYIATPSGWGSLASPITVQLWKEAEKWRMGSTLVVFALPEESK